MRADRVVARAMLAAGETERLEVGAHAQRERRAKGETKKERTMGHTGVAVRLGVRPAPPAVVPSVRLSLSVLV